MAIVGDQVIVAGAVVAHGERQSMASLEDKIEEARRTVGVELERFASNTLEYLKDEHHLVTDSLDAAATCRCRSGAARRWWCRGATTTARTWPP